MNLSIITTKMEYKVKGNHRDLTEIDFPDNVKTLYCWNNKLTSLKGCPNNVTELYCSDNNLTSLKGCSNSVTKLDCAYNNLTSLEECSNRVTYLDCWHNKLTSLKGCPNSVTTLYCDRNPLLPEWKNLSLNEIKTKNSVITINKLTFRSHIWKLYRCGFNKQILSFFV